MQYVHCYHIETILYDLTGAFGEVERVTLRGD